MKNQLLLSKRLFLEGREFAERNDAVSSGMAISLFQDAVEMFIWTLIKKRQIPVKESSQFTTNIEQLTRAGVELYFIPQLLELNKARVNFKHYGNLPAPDEAKKFFVYAEGFFNKVFPEYFGVSFGELSLVDLVIFEDVKERLKKANQLIESHTFPDAVNEMAIAKAMLFSRLDKYVPRVDQSLTNIDRSVGGIYPDIFRYLSSYLSQLREATLASLIRMPLQDYSFMHFALPNAVQANSGQWHIFVHARIGTYDEANCKQALDCLISLSIRMESLV